MNLQDRYGDRYRIAYDESRGRSRTKDPWLMIIPCQNGHIYPWGENMLAACTDRRGSVANRLLALDCTRVVQDGDDGVNVTFHVDDFDTVAAIMKPRRKRTVSAEERERLVAMGTANLNKRHVRSPDNVLKCTQTGPEVSEVVQAI